MAESPADNLRQQNRSPFYNLQFMLIFSIAFMIYCSSQMLMLTLPKFANELGATSQAVGLLAGIFAMCALSMRPFAGQIVDNENRRTMMRIVLFLILVSVFGLTLSKNYWMIVVLRGLNGIAWGIGSTLFMTMATNCFTEKNMAGGIGIYGLGQTIAQTVAPTFALPLANAFGYNSLYRINVVLISICLVLTLFIRTESREKHKRHYSVNLKNMIHIPALLPASLTLCSAIVKSSIQAFLVIFAGTMNIANIGMYFTVQAISIFISRPILSKMADRHGLLKILIPCEILAVAGILFVALSYSVPGFMIAAVLMGVSAGGEQPILMAECVKNVDPSKRGRASNTNYVGTDIGQFAGSNLAGVLVSIFGYRGMYRAVTIPLLLGTSIFWIVYRRNSKNS